MKERPILFSAPMVRAIVAGTKTHTRRIAKGVVAVHSRTGEALANIDSAGPRVPCPYGQPGDRLWVREAWAEVPRGEPLTDEDLPMRSDGRIVVYRADPEWNGARQFLCADGCVRWAMPKRWRPSIHMPRWASRILLEVVSVRVERLQDISGNDCSAEGASGGHGAIPGYAYAATRMEHYQHIWESINGPGSWKENPLVWVIEFKRVQA